MKSVDYIIVGQGLAGTLLAHELEKRGQSFQLFDPGLERSASVVGAGIVNPVTGRRIVKSWLIDEYLPKCKSTFQEIEALLDIEVYFQKNVLRVFYKAQQENDWLAKTALHDFRDFLVSNPDPAGFDQVLADVFSWGEVQQSAWVDMALTVQAYRKYFEEKQLIRPTKVDYDQIKWDDEAVYYEDIKAKGIVFCEGWKSAQNPFFQYLPHDPAKGEVLLIKLDHPPLDKIAKSKIFFVPWKENLYWTGSRYLWHQIDCEPTTTEREHLETILKEVLKVDYEVVEHLASVRPVFKGRRPMIGTHPEHKRLYIFNGLGTKGASQAPYWADQLSDYLTGELEQLNPEADISRINYQ